MSADEIDPALAHLYGDVDDDLDDVVPNRTTTLEELIETGPEDDEEISDEDVVELAVMVKSRQDAGTSSDEFLAEIGLGRFVPIEVRVLDPETGEETVQTDTLFELNSVGLRVVWQMAQDEGLVPKGARFGG